MFRFNLLKMSSSAYLSQNMDVLATSINQSLFRSTGSFAVIKALACRSSDPRFNAYSGRQSFQT